MSQNQHNRPETLPLFAQQPYGGPPVSRPGEASIEAMCPEARHLFDERAGIKEYDGGMSRAQAETEAWTETALERRGMEAKHAIAKRRGTPCN